jgi:hypothetical protein
MCSLQKGARINRTIITGEEVYRMLIPTGKEVGA